MCVASTWVRERRRSHSSSEGEKVFEKYEKRSFDVLDVQSRFLAKLSIEVMES